jgi:tetratricopeptide (TPR) repeat protein
MYRISRGIVAVLVILTLFCATAFAEKKVVTAEGKYVMGDLDSKQNAKALALMEAKRISLEKAGTYIESISEVRDFQLTKDQINSLAAGIMSVEILKEDWKMSGENMVLVLTIRATIDTSNLNSRIASMSEYKDSESNKEIKAQLEFLKKELADLKVQQLAVKDKTAPQQEMKAKNENIINKMAALDNLKAGQAALQVQNYKAAINSFKSALDIDPQMAEAYAGMSLAYQGTKDREKALEMAQTALKIAPRSAGGHYAISRIRYNDGNYDQSLESINRAIEFYPKSPFYFLHRADIYLKLRNSDAALNDYAQACAMNLYPACQRVDIIKKRIAENRSGDDLYRAPGLPERQPKTVAENMQAGYAALQAQNYKIALKAFSRAHDMNPKLAEAYAGMSLVYQGTREKEKALEMASTALKMAPRSAAGNYAMSKIKYNDGKYDEALEYVNTAIQSYPNSPYYFLHRADINMKLRNNEPALKDYEKACSMNVSWGCQRAQSVKQRMAETQK